MITHSPEVEAGRASRAEHAGADGGQKAERSFGLSLVLTGIRCVLQYIVLPFVLPVLGIAMDVASQISLAISVVAVGGIVYSVWRFWQIDYKYKWQYLMIAAVGLLILGVFISNDIRILTTP